jgi:hypothetical protein
MGAPEVSAFLTHLAVDGHAAVSTRNQALSVLLFLFRTNLDRTASGQRRRRGSCHVQDRLFLIALWRIRL